MYLDNNDSRVWLVYSSSFGEAQDLYDFPGPTVSQCVTLFPDVPGAILICCVSVGFIKLIWNEGQLRHSSRLSFSVGTTNPRPAKRSTSCTGLPYAGLPRSDPFVVAADPISWSRHGVKVAHSFHLITESQNAVCNEFSMLVISKWITIGTTVSGLLSCTCLPMWSKAAVCVIFLSMESS